MSISENRELHHNQTRRSHNCLLEKAGVDSCPPKRFSRPCRGLRITNTRKSRGTLSGNKSLSRRGESYEDHMYVLKFDGLPATTERRRSNLERKLDIMEKIDECLTGIGNTEVVFYE